MSVQEQRDESQDTLFLPGLDSSPQFVADSQDAGNADSQMPEPESVLELGSQPPPESCQPPSVIPVETEPLQTSVLDVLSATLAVQKDILQELKCLKLLARERSRSPTRKP